MNRKKTKVPMKKVTMVVEFETEPVDSYRIDEITKENLLNELVKIKSGPLENMFYATITSVKIENL